LSMRNGHHNAHDRASVQHSESSSYGDRLFCPGTGGGDEREDDSTVDSLYVGELLEALTVNGSPRSGVAKHEVEKRDSIKTQHDIEAEERGVSHREAAKTCDDAMVTDASAPVRSQDAITTLMVRNVPNRYTQQELLDEINRLGFQGKYDFLYLPLDVRNRCNVGYAFVNFRSAEIAAQFVKIFDKRPFRNQKRRIATCRPAHLQGVEANWEHCSKLANANAILLSPEGTVKSTSDWSMWDSPLHLAPLRSIAV